ncbi:Chymotrypsin-like protease CTRL-1 [Beauveria bassiana]|uniref:Chymotrypsin-like protease CTRL-1 n=1 Tax=Beauveria bassiana TaxID=176275 RepID=A0A2N6NVW2_BEABA|nr:Chymotrypsin-like protease CTRL-1 [Beauveria bassiana]
MRANAAVALTAGLPVALASVSMNKRIISPDESTDNYKFTVSIQDSNHNHLCGGMLLDSTTVLTAAHCFSAATDEGYVVAGKMDLTKEGGAVVNISTIQQPVLGKPNWKPAAKSDKINDIGIIKLATAIETSNEIEYAPLPKSADDLTPDSKVVAVGWGNPAILRKGEKAKPTEKRVEAAIPLQTMDKYTKSIGWDLGDTSTLLCAGKAGKNVCEGDSGGPLIDVKSGTLHLHQGRQSYLDFINNNLGQRGYTGGARKWYKNDLKLKDLNGDLFNGCTNHYNSKVGECIQPIDAKFGAVDGDLGETADDAKWDAYDAETAPCYRLRDCLTQCPHCVKYATLDWKLDQFVKCADEKIKN